jgi:hypothetical protein
VWFSFLLNGLIDKDAVFDGPSVSLAGICELPTVKIFTIEKNNLFSVFGPGKVGRGRQGGILLPVNSLRLVPLPFL